MHPKSYLMVGVYNVRRSYKEVSGKKNFIKFKQFFEMKSNSLLDVYNICRVGQLSST
jgi:hypothetical protein